MTAAERFETATLRMRGIWLQKKLAAAGFTLLEVIIVAAVIGLAATLTLPGVGRSMAVWELDGAARRLAADVRLAQAYSLNGGGLVYELQFLNVAPPYGYMITHPGAAGPVVDKKVYFPAHVRLGVTGSIWYNMNGFVNTGQTIMLFNDAAPGAVRRVVIEGAVGRVRIDGHN